MIASSLPSSFTLPSAVSASEFPEGSVPASRRVSIHVHPTPIPVSYSTIQKTVPAIVEDYAQLHGGRRPDIVLHMGIAATRNYYSVETQAHRDSYHLSDINGRSGFQDGELHWRKSGMPAILRAGRARDVNTASSAQPSSSPSVTKPCANPCPPDEHLLDVWKTFGPSGAELRISSDAGRYACEFIFYTSLAYAFQAGHDRSVAFLHVPGSCNEEDIEYGKDVTIAFIKALVTCWLDEKNMEQ